MTLQRVKELIKQEQQLIQKDEFTPGNSHDSLQDQTAMRLRNMHVSTDHPRPPYTLRHSFHHD